ncbi:MAG: matrixin family metalloprotease, partial [Sulfuricella sp.]
MPFGYCALRGLITDPHNLLADSAVSNQDAPAASDALIANAQSLLDQVKSDMNLTQGEVTMLIPDMPNVPPQDVPVMIAQANQAQSSAARAERTVGICQIIPNAPLTTPSLENVIEPIGTAQDYFYSYENKKTVKGPATITILQQPKHGILRLVTEADKLGAGKFDPSVEDYVYLPEKGYFGKDGVVVQVEIGGIKVKQNYYFYPVDNSFSKDWEQEYCKKGYHWKISTTLDPNGNSTVTAVDYLPSLSDSTSATNTAALVSTLDSSILTTLAVSTSGSSLLSTGITVNIADLPGGAVGETTGTSITLDTNAANYGWFIDPTPAGNSEFLPTANPDVWMAKAGTDAAGKMDMLSVLLHEYGHALGFEHSPNPNDFMAPDLQPGERRLPTSDELALMGRLVAQLQLGNATASGNSPAPNSPPSPTLPIGTALSALLIGRLRRTDYGAWSPVIDSVQIPAPAPQFETAANQTGPNQ